MEKLLNSGSTSYSPIDDIEKTFENPSEVFQESSSFLSTNSFVAKLAFLLLVVIVFLLLLKLGIYVMGKIFGVNPNPILVDGMIDSRNFMIIPQDPKKANSIPVIRSVNKKDGIEFTWSVWINVDDFSYKNNQYRHIFHKGNDNMHYDGDQIGMNFPNNGPGLYLAPNDNKLVVMMNTFKNIKEEIEIPNIPEKKWLHIVIRNNQKKLDVFVNGTLAKSHLLSGVPKQNYGDVYVAMNGGFMGHTSSLRYYNSALNVFSIKHLTLSGPNLNPVSNKGSAKKQIKPGYFSMRWYMSGNEDSYNP